jgi:hypothetical protein
LAEITIVDADTVGQTGENPFALPQKSMRQILEMCEIVDQRDTWNKR